MTALLGASLLLPTAALASLPHASSPRGGGTTGGAGLGGTSTSPAPTTTTPTTGTATTPAPGSPVTTLVFGSAVSAAADGITLAATGSAFKGHRLTLSGTAGTTDAGDTVQISYLTPGPLSTTVDAAQASVSATGDFSAHWTATVSGQLSFTAALIPPGASAAADPLATSFTIQVFKSAVATIYGPGLWNHRTACGERLRKTTLGVANRTLKCGTPVAVYYGNREIVVPVIDRGPFTKHANWDLTSATAQALGVKQTVTVGTISPWPQSQQLPARS